MTRPYGGMTTPSNTLQRTHLMGFRCWFWRESWKWSEILGKQLDYISVWGTRKESSKRYQKRLSLKWHPACPKNSWHRLLSEGLHQLALFQQFWDIHGAIYMNPLCQPLFLLQFTTKMIISPLRPNPRDISCIISGEPSQFLLGIPGSYPSGGCSFPGTCSRHGLLWRGRSSWAKWSSQCDRGRISVP